MTRTLLEAFLLLVLCAVCLCTDAGVETEVTNPPPKRGFVMCSGRRHIRYLKRNIYLLRHLWNSTLPFAVVHCNELPPEYQNEHLKMDSSVQFVDLCQHEQAFGMPVRQAQEILRGFYCKIGALIQSPFQETIMMDIDVVWLNHPELMFNAKGYNETGALFMRARMNVHDNTNGLDHSPQSVAPLHLRNYFESMGIEVDHESARKQLEANGVNLFWHGFAHAPSEAELTKVAYIDNIQDSSIMLVDKARHPGMLHQLEKYLQENFKMGYGDKELFWVAATVAREPFSFEPFASGQYGDCYGVMIHFDPSANSVEEAKPWYANAEFMVERGSEKAGVFLKELNIVGEYLHNVITKPILVTPEMPLASMNTWKLKPGNVGCTCLNAPGASPANKGVIPCMSAPTELNYYFLAYEWLTYSSTLNLFGSQQTPQPPLPNTPIKDDWNKCVPVFLRNMEQLDRFFHSSVDPRGCDFIGCPALPMRVEVFPSSRMDVVWLNHSDSQICDPVSFRSSETGDYPTIPHNITASARQRMSSWNHPVLKVGSSVGCSACGFKTVYYYDTDLKLHAFPSLQSFIKKGLDFKDTVQLKPHQFHSFEIGADIPA